jgi:hypothetical protein
VNSKKGASKKGASKKGASKNPNICSGIISRVSAHQTRSTGVLFISGNKRLGSPEFERTGRSAVFELTHGGLFIGG